MQPTALLSFFRSRRFDASCDRSIVIASTISHRSTLTHRVVLVDRSPSILPSSALSRSFRRVRIDRNSYPLPLWTICHPAPWSFPGLISIKCWMGNIHRLKRPACLLKQFSLIEIISTVVLLAMVVVDSSRVFYGSDSDALQGAHRCTHAPHGILAG